MARDMEKRIASMEAWVERNKEEILRKARERAEKYRKTAAYKNAPSSSPEYRRAMKEKYRRQAGIPERKKGKTNDSACKKKAAFIAAENFVGPPKPSKALSEAAFYSWRVENNPVFYAKELDRAQRYKARTRHGYKDSILRWQDMPPEVVLAKHQMYLVSKQIRWVLEDEKHC